MIIEAFVLLLFTGLPKPEYLPLAMVIWVIDKEMQCLLDMLSNPMVESQNEIKFCRILT